MTKHIFKEYNTNDLFKPSDNWKLNACVGKNGGPYYYNDYSIGYFEAGKRLFESLKHSSRLVDVIVYPFVYTYRHAIELGIKHLCIVMPGLLDRDIKIAYSHKLIDNWNMVKPLLENLPGGYNVSKPIHFVDKVLNDMVHFDPRGEVFRFPMDKSSGLYLQDSSLINVGVYGDVMQEVYKCFEFWFTAVDVIYDYKNETESNYREMMEEYENK